MLNGHVLLIQEEYYKYCSGATACIRGHSFRLEAIVTDEAFHVCEGDALHVESAPQWCKVDAPEVETLLAGQHLIGKKVWTLEAVQQGVEVNQGHSHLLKKGTKMD